MDQIERYGLTRTINPNHFFPTIDAAVEAFRQQTGAHWADAATAGQGQSGAPAEQAAQGKSGAAEQAAPGQPDRTPP